MIFTQLQTRLPDGPVNTSSNTEVYVLNAFVGIGFDNGRWYAGAKLENIRANQVATPNSVLITDNFFRVEGFLGYRFNAPAPLTRLFNRAESLMDRVFPGR